MPKEKGKEHARKREHDMQWEKQWKAMVSELRKGAQIPGLWRMLALLETEAVSCGASHARTDFIQERF